MTGLLFCLPAFQERIAQTCEAFDAAIRARGLSSLGKPGHIPDEWMLREMVERAGIGLPPQWKPGDDPTGGIAAGDPANYRQTWFRPWHGVNLGWARQAGGLQYAKCELQEQPSVLAAMAHLTRLSEYADFHIAYDVLAPRMQARLDTWFEAYNQVRNGI